MNCEICFNKYNLSKHKPITLMPCGHTFCLYCVENFNNEKYNCPTCREQISNQKPNYTVLNIINSSVTQEVNLKLKKSISQGFKDIDETQRKYNLDYLKKIEETKDKFTLMKRKINLKTTELMNILLSNQEYLLDSVDELESKCLTDLSKAIQANDENQSFERLKKLDTNKMNPNDLYLFKSELDKINANLINRLNRFNEISYNFDFRENDKFTAYGNRLLGDLVYAEPNESPVLQSSSKRIKNNDKENIPSETKRASSGKPHRSNSSVRHAPQSETKIKVYSANHEHPFNVIKRSEHDWICDGSKIFGACKSNIDSCGKSKGKIRYRCAVCSDFDLCQTCLHAPKIEIRKK